MRWNLEILSSRVGIAVLSGASASYQCRHATSALVTDSGRSLKAFISLKARIFSQTDSGIHSCIHTLPTYKHHENLLRGGYTLLCSQAADSFFPRDARGNILVIGLQQGELYAFRRNQSWLSNLWLSLDCIYGEGTATSEKNVDISGFHLQTYRILA